MRIVLKLTLIHIAVANLLKQSLSVIGSAAMKKKRVCIIGAGAAGLIALRHVKDDHGMDGVIFEQGDTVGGIWKYTDKVGNNKYGTPIHSTAYYGLRTNLPKEIMGYLDYPFPHRNQSYISHQEVQEYLESFAAEFGLLDCIHFNSCVINVAPLKNDAQIVWNVQIKDLQSQSIENHDFDAVLVCNGHYTKPYFPDIKNLDTFQGEVSHSRDYRKPDSFTGKNVIVLGGGPSAIDISIEISQVASQVTLSCKNPMYTMPPNIVIKPPVVEARNNSFLTASGEEIHCDSILLCSGYVYDFPFLSPECGITVENGKFIFPLYRHLINAKNPTMAFIGVAFTVCPFPQFDIQVRYFLKILKGDCAIPSEQEMIREIRDFHKTRRDSGLSLNHSHKLGDSQWAYNELLASDGGFSNLIKPVVQAAYDKAGDRRQNDPANYKFDYVRIIDDAQFEYIEDYYSKQK